MAEADYATLQRRYGGRFVARRGGEVVAHAESYDALADRLESMGAEWDTLIVEYVEPADRVSVY